MRAQSIALVLVFFAPLGACVANGGVERPGEGSSTPAEHAPAPAASAPAGIALTTLSRGRGVPERARAVFGEARKLLEEARARGEVIALDERVIGLEGERRLCAEPANEKAAERIWRRLLALCRGVELLELRREACAQAAPQGKDKENTS